MDQKANILFEEIDGVDGNIGLITLNRQEALNALNHEMLVKMDAQLVLWDDDANIKAVIVQAAEGRAFCAGGDIRAVYENREKKVAELARYFSDEYRADSRIYHFSKPYIAFLDGITMGGGVGISIHGSYRIATERMVFAMPETGIGFFPDIGASYFLPRLPHKIGFYLGLAGAKIPFNDCKAIGLVDQIVVRDAFPDILQKIAATSLTRNPDATIAELMRHFSVPVEKSELLQHQGELETCFSKNKMEDIISSLEHYPTAWCEQLANNLLIKSPTSLKVTFEMLKRGAKLNFDDCMQMEFNLASRFIQGHDFFEGVRAAIIDKDQKPQWQPNSLQAVSDEMIEEYFTAA
jgi:enoyl-CoA hydratase